MRATADERIGRLEFEPKRARKPLKCRGFGETVKQIPGRPAANRSGKLGQGAGKAGFLRRVRRVHPVSCRWTVGFSGRGRSGPGHDGRTDGSPARRRSSAAARTVCSCPAPRRLSRGGDGDAGRPCAHGPHVAGRARRRAAPLGPAPSSLVGLPGGPILCRFSGSLRATGSRSNASCPAVVPPESPLTLSPSPPVFAVSTR